MFNLAFSFSLSFFCNSSSYCLSFSSSFLVFISSFCYFFATSITYEPAIIFSSIFLSFWISFCCLLFAFSYSFSLFYSSSSNLFFSSSLKFFSCMMRCFSSSAFRLMSSFSFYSFSSNSFIFSLSSTNTYFSTSMIYLPIIPCFFISSVGSAPDYNAANCILKFCTSSWYSLSSASFGSSLILGLFSMFFALLAYLRVFIVSS